MNTLFDRENFETYVGSLPNSFVTHQWGDASVGKVGSPERSKIFAILSRWSQSQLAIAFKCSKISFEILSGQEGVRPAPYLARAGWVQVSVHSALDQDDLRAYIAQANRLAWETLPVSQRKMLGIAQGVS